MDLSDLGLLKIRIFHGQSIHLFELIFTLQTISKKTEYRISAIISRDLPMAEYIGLYRTFSIIGHRYRPPIVFTFLAEGLAEGLA